MEKDSTSKIYMIYKDNGIQADVMFKSFILYFLELTVCMALTIKAPITTAAADDIHKYFFIVFQRK